MRAAISTSPYSGSDYSLPNTPREKKPGADSVDYSYTTTTPEVTTPVKADGTTGRTADKPIIPPLKIGEIALILSSRIESPTRVLPAIQHFQKRATRILDGVKKSLPWDEQETEKALAGLTREFVASGRGTARSDLLNLKEDIRRLVQQIEAEAPKQSGDSPADQQSRRIWLIDFLGKIFRNEFSSDTGRWAANVVNVGVRTGLIVTLCTLMRDALAFEVRKAHELGHQETPLYYAGILAIVIGPSLNLMGGALSLALGEANPTSLVSRLVLLTTSLGMILACYLTGSLNTLGTVFPAFACYNAARDLLNYLFPLSDNCESLPKRGVALAGLVYGAFQCFGGIAMDHITPLSGANAFPRPSGNETIPWNELAAARFDHGQSLGHAGLNAFLEVGDDLVVPTIVRFLENKAYAQREGRNIRDEAVHKQYIKDLTQFAHGLLAEDDPEARQNSIDKKNLELYEQEIKRLREQSDPLDGTHQGYLLNLQTELQLYLDAQKLRVMYGTLNQGEKVDEGELRNLENRTGVYTKARELARMKDKIQKGIIDPQDEKFLKLEEEVAKITNRLHALKSKKIVANDRDAMKDLENELIIHDADEILPSRLPPISTLTLGSSNNIARNFASLDKDIAGIIRKRHTPLNKTDHERVVKELFVYEFVKTYLPLPIFTELEHQTIISNKKKGILPIESLQSLHAEIEARRLEATEGPRIKVHAAPWLDTADATKRLARSMLLSDGSRQSVFLGAVGFFVFMSGWLAEWSKEGETEAVILPNLLVATATVVGYMALYLAHVEGARSGRVERPGFQAHFPPIREQEQTELLTPRPHNPEEEQSDRRAISEAYSSDASGSDSGSDRDSIEDDTVIKMPDWLFSSDRPSDQLASQ